MPHDSNFYSKFAALVRRDESEEYEAGGWISGPEFLTF